MRASRIAIAALTLAACKGDKHGGAHVGSAGSATGVMLPRPDAGVAPPIDWPTCEAALRQAATAPLDVRPGLVIDGCAVCGDWAPILKWNTPEASKGPQRHQIEEAMERCNAFCNSTAKQHFMGTLDSSRGTSTRTPWRHLGEQCKADVSAVPDNRFTSAPLFALDRIARAIASHGGEAAKLAQAVELPLPAVSLTGAGIVISDVDTDVTPSAGPIAITIVGGQIHVAKLPRARLGASGLAIDLGNYPGDEVKADGIPAALAKLAAGDATTSIAILAPTATPAETLVPLIAAAAPVAPVYLAVNAPGSPEGWDLPGTIPIALAVGPSKDTLKISHQLTAQNLATELGRRAKAGAKKVALSIAK